MAREGEEERWPAEGAKRKKGRVKTGQFLSCTRLRVPLSRYTCRATRVAADFLDFIAFCRCSTGVALHPLKILVSHLPPPVPGGVAPKFGSEKVSRYTGVSQLQLRVSRYTVQLRSVPVSNSKHFLEMPAVALLELRLWGPALQSLTGITRSSKILSSNALRGFP